MRVLWPLLLLTGCELPDVATEPACDPRRAWYPDADGDGVGEATDMYVGCKGPEGWVEEPPPRDSGTLSQTGDTGTAHTGGSGATPSGR